MNNALKKMNSGRPGPVLLDIPLNIQLSEINKKLKIEKVKKEKNPSIKITDLKKVLKLIKTSKRPLIIAGAGIRTANAIQEFRKFIEFSSIPFVTGMSSVDLVEKSHPYLAGRTGITGDRSGNFAIQKSDLIISIGSRLSYKVTGYDLNNWGKNAKKVMIDIDSNEVMRTNIDINIRINGDAKDFIKKLKKLIRNDIKKEKPKYAEWNKICQKIKKQYPINREKNFIATKKVNIYNLYSKLSKFLKQDSIIVSTAGMSRIVGAQALSLKKNQRFIVNLTAAPMGYCLPAVLGVSLPNEEIICVTGDGSLQMNIQELQTITHEKIILKIIVLNNDGYHSIRQTQKNFFKNDKVAGVG